MLKIIDIHERVDIPGPAPMQGLPPIAIGSYRIGRCRIDSLAEGVIRRDLMQLLDSMGSHDEE
jgi:hypothetical protein